MGIVIIVADDKLNKTGTVEGIIRTKNIIDAMRLFKMVRNPVKTINIIRKIRLIPSVNPVL